MLSRSMTFYLLAAFMTTLTSWLSIQFHIYCNINTKSYYKRPSNITIHRPNFEVSVWWVKYKGCFSGVA